MIVGSIENLNKDSGWLPGAICEALNWLVKTDLAAMPVGKHEIRGADMFVLIQEYTTLPKPEKQPEAHDKYLDIQYVISGAEVIEYSLRRGDYPVDKDNLAEKDIIYFKGVRDGTDVVLTAGMYAIMMPDDVHRPCCVLGKPGPVRKAVIKLSMALVHKAG